MIVAVLGYLMWPVALYAGYLWGTKRREEPLVPLPPGEVVGKYLVVARTASGARARQMFERGTAGTGETLELWDGPNCRGRKGTGPKETE